MSLDNLPVEWSVSQLAKMIASEGLISDGDWIESKDQDEKGGIRLIQLADIGDGDFRDKSNRYMNQDAFNRLNCVELKANDVLIARMPDPLGRACIFPKLPYKCVTVVDVCLIRTGEESAISPKLLKYWINSTQIRNLIALNATGTTRKRITRKKLESFDFPVPPLAEQQEIVRQLDVMLAQVEQIKARLDAIPAILKKFRQSVLADAVSGKLLDENTDIWQENFLSDLTSKITDGEHLTPPIVDSGVPLLSAKDVHEQYIDFDNCKFIERGVADKALSRCNPQYHDLLVVSRGATVGRTHYLKNSKEFCLMGSVLLIRANMELINPAYLDIFFKSELGRKQLISSSGASAQQAIYIRDVKKMKIRYPNLEEQEKIILKVSELFKFIEQIEKTIQLAQKRVNLLTQSILAKAFSGELTAEWREQHQDLISGVNSAESLLAKIQAEREASKPVKKTRAKKQA